jgi:hypothetical protein
MATPVRMPTRRRAAVHSTADDTLGSARDSTRVGAHEAKASGARSDASGRGSSGSSGSKYRSPLALGIPLLLGIIYGAYAAAIARSGGAATWGQLALALISGAALAALLFGLVRVQNSLPRELRAAAWMLLVGGSVGFLYSLTGHSVLLSSVIGLAVGVSTFIATFYRYYTREP